MSCYPDTTLCVAGLIIYSHTRCLRDGSITKGRLRGGGGGGRRRRRRCGGGAKSQPPPLLDRRLMFRLTDIAETDVA